MSNKEAKFLTILRPGKIIDSHIKFPKHRKIGQPTPIEKLLPSELNENETQSKLYVPKAFYIHRLLSLKKSTHYDDFHLRDAI